MDRVYRRSWVGVGLEDDVHAPGSYRDGRRRAGSRRRRPRRTRAPCARSSTCAVTAVRRVAYGSGSARTLQCSYHGWVYRLDGSLARAAGVGEPEGFDLACSASSRSAFATFTRLLFVNVDPAAADFDPGPLGARIQIAKTRRSGKGREQSYYCSVRGVIVLPRRARSTPRSIRGSDR